MPVRLPWFGQLSLHYLNYSMVAPTTYLVGKFRADFGLLIIMCVVKRAAAMQLGSGLPSGCVRGDLGLLTASAALVTAAP